MIIDINQGGSGLSNKYEGRKIVLILGAGCTYSEGIKRKEPPLDKNFFSKSQRTNKKDVGAIQRYFEEHYNLDICKESNGYDSLEYVMVSLFADINDLSIGQVAYKNFSDLVKLFNRRLADTTNRIKPHPKSNLFRIIANFLKKGAKPKNISIITFNQDIQIEKTLASIESCQKYKQFGPLLNFPYCYVVPPYRKITSDRITGPKNSKETFAKGAPDKEGIQILKLHGSLNWYSLHKSPKVSVSTLFKQDKKLLITKRKEIDPEMQYAGGKRRQYTFPIIVPPVSQKSAIFHSTISRLWPGAEKRLKNATDVVIFGYSCPEADHESSNLIQRTLKSKILDTFSIIDPAPKVVSRFVKLTEQERVYYYTSADAYINSNQE